MRRVVVDAPTVLAWFDADGPGSEMRREYEAGAFAALAPRRIHEDLLAAIAERTRPTAAQLARIAAELPHLGIVVQDPPLPLVAGWLARGLDAQTAPYAALAESLDLRLATSDPRLARTAAALVSS
jgi:predicted nucleic acid-binding protein